MDQVQQWLDSITASATVFLSGVSDWLYTWIMLAVLTGTGIYLTIRSKGLQLRHFADMARHVVHSRKGARGGISSFQAFAIGMATRIGIGNITGVALAIILGGPGALFWMWLVALFGMATAFAEATLAQLFKKRHPDGTFRGGPASYILRGLRSRPLAIAFAVAMVFSMTVAMPMVQSNTIAGVLENSQGVAPWVTGLVVAGLTAVVIFGGVRGVARATEIISPAMALVYLVIAAAVVIMNIDALPAFFSDVFLSAFGLRESLAGIGGGVLAALINGMRRGLFSNEAGMGTNPNAAATATVAHPVQQGLIQSFGVFIDTMFVCTATGFIILTSGVLDLANVTPDDSGVLTTVAITNTLGDWMAWPVAIMIFFFGFSSILGAYAYGEGNLVFLGANKTVHMLARASMVVFSFVGAVLALTFVWVLMDLAMFVVTILNLVAVLSLSRWVIAALKDYERQRAEIARNGYVLVRISNAGAAGVGAGSGVAGAGAGDGAGTGADAGAAGAGDGVNLGSPAGELGRFREPVFVPAEAGLPGEIGSDAWDDAYKSAEPADAPSEPAR
ncbi:alanine/glycine:cation symporter family protein [Trueperella bialowiezensis]|uniref:Na+/alanine symporter n=1 Tax=Trueperella bialowiezensis TaxID=312285 RepID=A0A448PFC0_9ACTO|nr:alanine/glycine:cation symporter family protein [Trueperella bialowiezensis]VEI13610.1 Na+/alanine symporter [Trueperella bialowiezensis]